MPHYQKALLVYTTGKSLINITAKIKAIVAESEVKMGLCTIFIRHTSASLIIQENADPDVLTDLANFLARLVPEDPTRYLHKAEGADDMPAHIRSALTQTSQAIPIANSRRHWFSLVGVSKAD